MKKISILITSLFFTYSLLAQTDSLKNTIRFSVDINNLLKGEGINIGYIGYERAVFKKSSLLLWAGYDFSSTNLIIDKVEKVVHSQNIKSRFDYRQYLENNKRLSGFYAFSSLKADIGMTTVDNEKNYDIGSYFGLGYQYILKNIVFDTNIDKGYSYSVLKNDGIEYISSTITPFYLSFSVGYNF